MEFNPLDYPQAWTNPSFLSERSAWIGHIPFAMVLLEMARPRVLVELGTHMGDSYCGFCQGIEAMKLPTRCTAVDSWQGDAHAGEYGPEVLQRLRDYHDPRYGSFSTLMQSDFDSASATFPDGSIDLLHIDGLHTYEAVRHDYETWRPKLSERGIVLFHDIAVRDHGFGVWRLWEEVSRGFPAFAFEHSFGLGVLAIGAQQPEGVLAFLTDANRRSVQVRAYFKMLAQGVQLLRMTRYCVSAMDWQRKELDRWRVSKGLAPRDAPVHPTSIGAIRSLIEDFSEVIRRST